MTSFAPFTVKQLSFKVQHFKGVQQFKVNISRSATHKEVQQLSFSLQFSKMLSAQGG